MQRPSLVRGTRIGRLDGHQAGLEVERRGHAVQRLEALARDRVDVAVHVDEAGAHHESGDVDDVRLCVALLVARRRPDGDDTPAVDDDVRHPFRPGARVHHQTTAENQHSAIQLHNVGTLIG